MENITNQTNQQPPIVQVDQSQNTLKQKMLAILSDKDMLVRITCIVGVLVILISIYFLVTLGKPNSSRTTQDAAVQSYIAKSKEAYEKGEYVLAVDEAKKGLGIDPTNKTLLISIISALASENQMQGQPHKNFLQALQYLKQAQKLYPNDASIATAIGYAYEADAQYAQAHDAYAKALEDDPSSASVLFHIGHLYEAQGNQQAAFINYNKAFALDSSDPLILMGKARQALFSGKQADAFNYYKSVTDETTAPDRLKAEAYSGQAQIKQQQLIYEQQALDLAKKGVDADPAYAPADATYGYNLGINGSAQEGVNWMNKGITLDPTISGIYWQKGIIDRSVKRYRAAITDFTQAIQESANDATLLGPTNKDHAKGQYYYDLAKTYSMANAGKVSDVLDNLQKAISYNPAVKTFIINDFQNDGIFKNVAQYDEFKSLIK